MYTYKNFCNLIGGEKGIHLKLRISEFTLLQTCTCHGVCNNTVNNNGPIQDYVHPDDQTRPTFEMTPGIKPFTESTT